MKHYGDICRMNGAEVERVECVIGGSPCQDLSVAGKRAGLAGERSGLFMEQIRIIKEMRERDRDNGRTDTDVYPRFMVFENVPGLFSSNDGEDFRAVLEETARVAKPDAVIPRYKGGRWTNAGAIIGDGYSIAWRTIDSQYWGTPQRRRRVALVADFNGLLASEILFERGTGGESGSEVYPVGESLSGNPEPGGPEGEEAAGDPAGGIRTTGESLCFRNHYDGRVLNETSLTLDTCGGGEQTTLHPRKVKVTGFRWASDRKTCACTKKPVRRCATERGPVLLRE